jgi:hypothetical protein
LAPLHCLQHAEVAEFPTASVHNGLVISEATPPVDEPPTRPHPRAGQRAEVVHRPADSYYTKLSVVAVGGTAMVQINGGASPDGASRWPWT